MNLSKTDLARNMAVLPVWPYLAAHGKSSRCCVNETTDGRPLPSRVAGLGYPEAPPGRLPRGAQQSAADWPVSKCPADYVAAEDVEDNVEVETRSPDGSLEFGVSRPWEFHPRPLAEPDVSLSTHPAPIIQH
jgi:hypothetical protein